MQDTGYSDYGLTNQESAHKPTGLSVDIYRDENGELSASVRLHQDYTHTILIGNGPISEADQAILSAATEATSAGDQRVAEFVDVVWDSDWTEAKVV